MLDALSGRDKHGRLTITSKSRSAQFAFFFHTSEWELKLFYVATILHTICAYLDDGHTALALGLTAPCLLVFILDIAAKIHYMTPRDCLSKTWNMAQVPSHCHRSRNPPFPTRLLLSRPS